MSNENTANKGVGSTGGSAESDARAFHDQTNHDALRYNWLRIFANFSAVDALLNTTQFNTLDAAVDHLMNKQLEAIFSKPNV